MISWKNWDNHDESPNLLIALRMYRKQFSHLVVEKDILYRFSYDDCGKVKYDLFCVPKTPGREVVFCLLISKTAGHVLAKTVEERDSFFQNLPNF